MKKLGISFLLGLACAAAPAAETFKHLSCDGQGLRLSGDATVNVRFAGTLREEDGAFRLTHYSGYLEVFDHGGFQGFGVTEGKEVAGREYTEGRKYTHHVVFPLVFTGNDRVQLLHDRTFAPHEASEIILKLGGFAGGYHGYLTVTCNAR